MNDASLPPPLPAEALALEVARALPGTRIGCSSTGRGQAAWTFAAERPAAAVSLWFLDRFQFDAALAAHGTVPDGLTVACAPDPPPGPLDLAVVPLSCDGEAELSRDMLQAALLALEPGGHLVAAVDNPRDTWLHGQLADTKERVGVRRGSDAVAYVVTKSRPPRQRDFSATVVFRDRERLLTAFTRPGVFAHRRVDPAARHLLNAVDVAPGTRVVDIGCGSGCVALGIAARDPSVVVHALDSNARAVDCTRRAAAANGLDNVTVTLEAGGAIPNPGSWDLVLANPPYYADFRIAKLFVDAAHRALAPGGTLLVATKRPTWYLETLPATWRDVAREEVKHYHLVEAVRP
ncbi:MAG: methyltransferase [Planctomycetes bacterium]|nr:methyltransferase [Planctomycetota bacterium]